MRKWDTSDDIVAFYLYKFGTVEEIKKSSLILDIKLTSLKMRISNFAYLDNKNGLDNYAKQSREVYNKYRNYSNFELKKIFDEIINSKTVKSKSKNIKLTNQIKKQEQKDANTPKSEYNQVRLREERCKLINKNKSIVESNKPKGLLGIFKKATPLTEQQKKIIDKNIARIREINEILSNPDLITPRTDKQRKKNRVSKANMERSNKNAELIKETGPLIDNKNEKSKKTNCQKLKDNFEEYLIDNGYSQYTPSGKPSTVYDYIKRVEKICDREGISIEDLSVNINFYVKKYDTDGVEAEFGRKSNNAFISSLKRFKEFCKKEN
ncbi:hypothetical protein [Flavobacterium aciduliphilum]|uniref:Uncharacterized protein n=1 Tax=Flavobacterium aciduliphilum TaxID=1101402 RepID=A0A328YSL0_9FLAO|nr:hypothetical protein [Flavobacterium aciduliphilum]RAR75765.1 hypothetical protein CLV55_101470 [Flavobacterium aciduliphilum]